MTKTEQQMIDLAIVRQFLIDLSGDSQSENPYITWFSASKHQFSCHFLGVLCQGERIHECMTAAEEVAVKAFNHRRKEKVSSFEELLAKANNKDKVEKAMKKIEELNKEIELLKTKYNL